MGGKGSFLPWWGQQQRQAGLPQPTPYGQPAIPNPASLVAGAAGGAAGAPVLPGLPAFPGVPGVSPGLKAIMPTRDFDRFDRPELEIMPQPELPSVPKPTNVPSPEETEALAQSLGKAAGVNGAPPALPAPDEEEEDEEKEEEFFPHKYEFFSRGGEGLTS